MNILRWLAGGLLAAALLNGGCGEGTNPPSRLNARLGDADAGTPFGARQIDPGILQDQTAYSPAPLPAAGGGAGGGSSAAAGSGAVQTEVLALLDGVLKAAVGGDFDALLDAFNAEAVAELKKDTSTLQDTYEKVAQLCRVIGAKIGKPDMTVADALKEAGTVAQSFGVPPTEMEAAAMFEVSVVDPENASIQGKLGGGAKPFVVKKEADGWRIQLPEPVTAAQVEEMTTGLKKLQQLLDKLTDQVEKSEATTIPELMPVFMTAIAEYQAEMVGAAADAAAAAPPADAPAVDAPGDQPANPRMAGGGRDEPTANENTNDNSSSENENEDGENENENGNDNDGG